MIRVKPGVLPPLTMVSGSFIWLYNETIVKLIGDWSNNPNFSHGFLIPFISGYMIWTRREELSSMPIKPSNYGLIAIGFGMLLYFVGNIGAELFTVRFSMIVTLVGLSMYLLGTAIGRKLFFPVVFMVFMIPVPSIVWNELAFPLQVFAAGLSASVVQSVGIPVLREGNVLHLASTSLEVVDACSGLRSLTSLLALSGAFAYMSPLRIGSKCLLFLSAIPVAVAVNIARLSVTAVMAHQIGKRATEGLVHDLSGLSVFVLAFPLLYCVYRLLLHAEKKLDGGDGERKSAES
jgi:exosortase